MMGRSHAASGWCAGLAVAPLLGAATLPQAVVVATVTAGAALLPDLDHPGARASRILGPVTGLLSRGLRAGSSWLYHRTRGPRDERHDGEHRHATHTLLFAVLLGVGTAVGTWWAGTGGGDMVGDLGGVPVGIAVGVGCFVHCLGDALTLSGCPFLFPLPIAGETWYELRPPRFLRFRTGGPVESLLMFPAFTVAGVLLLPGVWPIAVGAVATFTA